MAPHAYLDPPYWQTAGGAGGKQVGELIIFNW